MLEKIQSKTDNRTQVIGVKSSMGIGERIQNDPIPKSIKIVMDNTANPSKAKTFAFGDAMDLMKSHLGNLTAVKVAPEGIDVDVFNNYIKTTPMMLELMRFEAAVSSSQFENELIIQDADLDGLSKPDRIYMNEAVDGEKFDAKIQSYRGKTSFGPRRAFILTVNPGEKVTATLYIQAILNRF